MATGLAYIICYYNLDKLGAVCACSVACIPPVVAIVIGVYLVGEKSDPVEYLKAVPTFGRCRFVEHKNPQPVSRVPIGDEHMQQVDLAIVGAGIVGLAHAVHAALAGLSVAVFERDPAADGASVRNFGMLAVAAQPPGRQLDDARRALRCWAYVAQQAEIEMQRSGCLFLARQPEEMNVLEEYAAREDVADQGVRVLTGVECDGYAANLRSDNIVGGLWSPEVWKVDQRQAAAKMVEWLAREHGVSFHFSTEVLAVGASRVETSAGSFGAEQVVVCGGDEFATLFPQAFRETQVVRCRLQMLRTNPQPGGWQLKPFILGGLSMTRYAAFASCSSLPDLIERQTESHAAHLAHGIHVIACQEADGSVTIGDSHVYGDALDEERSDIIDRLILADLAGMISLPDTRIAQRWLGHYAHLPGTRVLKLKPAKGVTAVTVTNGQGMTHAFAIAADILNELGLQINEIR